jgi:predicted ATPase/DNA-binding SARP family transcriptional activator/DNA-binding CsgD family transcriptional regulator
VGTRILEDSQWRLRKAAALVKLLALAPSHRMQREQVMALLWPDSRRRPASNNLRTTLHAARKVLDPAAGSDYLASEGESLVLCPVEQLWVDVDAFEEAAATARRARDPAAYRTSIELYAGDLLPEDRYEEWAEGRREELRKMYVDLLVEMASLYEGRGEWEPAIEALRRVIAEEPVLEDAYVGLMRLYAFSGLSGQALAQYEQLRETLQREFGAEPGASVRAFREEIASGRFPPHEVELLDFPSREAEGLPRHNLPVPRTSFVDRQRELTELKTTLAMTRLLTLTGVGGSGKTRLSLEVATDLAAAHSDGVWFVDLAPLSEPDLVPQAIASAVGAREQPGQPLAETVTQHLGEKRGLLVLDNCEHLVDAVAHLVDILLTSCPNLKVLATSREPLGVEGEVLFSVPPLPVPTELPTDSRRIGGNDSVRLFVERTRLRLPGFLLTQENARAVVAVCRRLEGLPLALELAAARMGTLATDQMAERLKDSLGLLSTGARTVPARQRTMKAAIGWSYGLFSRAEKGVSRRLSIFAGGFTLEAAETVCPDGGIKVGEVLDLLSNLVDKSLVLAEMSTESRVRYRMLEPVRQYALEKLEESGEAEAVRRQHASFFLALAERAGPKLRGPGQVEWLERLEADNGNLRAAMAWLLEAGEVEDAVRLGWALWIFWLIHGHQVEGLAEVAAAQGEPQHAARLFGAAEAALEDAGSALYPYARDRTLHEQALETIRSQLDEATFSTAWARGNAMTWREAVEYALSSGNEPASPTTVTVPEVHPPTLTSREQELAGLVARGLTNRQIATELYISEHTVANHVAKILRKLGFDSRSQITAWVMERRTPT